MNFVNMLNGYLWSYILIGLLLISGIAYTLVSNFLQFRLSGDMIRLVAGKLKASDDTSSKNGKRVSAFQSFCISVSSHVGTGNLAGVAIALILGGPGALFWMWVTALLGCATSLIENTLAQLYKEKTATGCFSGGPAYYMKKALGWQIPGTVFSVLVIVTFSFAFNTVQANTIAQACEGSLKLNTTITGSIIAILTGCVIFGGVHRIARFSSTVVPTMAIGYVAIAIGVLVLNAAEIPSIFSRIIGNAFDFHSAAGGFAGSAVMQGVKRGLYSNEAGMGSTPNAAAVSHVRHPAFQGILQSFGVFVDTIVICSATGFIVLFLPDYAAYGETGIKLTQIALSHEVGTWGTHFITACLFLFAFSSIIGNYYYGETNLVFLTNNNKIFLLVFRVLCVAVVYIGAAAKLSDVWDIADLFMGMMAIINIITIALLSPKALAVLRHYVYQRAHGITPIYHASQTPEIVNSEVWV